MNILLSPLRLSGLEFGATYTLNTSNPWFVKEDPFVQTREYVMPCRGNCPQWLGTQDYPYYRLKLRTPDGAWIEAKADILPKQVAGRRVDAGGRQAKGYLVRRADGTFGPVESVLGALSSVYRYCGRGC